MEFIKELQKQKDANTTSDYRTLKSINCGKYRLSIQGSKGHYCSPRQSVSIEKYVAMEIAIFNKRHSFVSANRSSVIRKFPRYNELIERADCLNSRATVYGYVNVDLINDLFLFLKNNS